MVDEGLIPYYMICICKNMYTHFLKHLHLIDKHESPLKLGFRPQLLHFGVVGIHLRGVSVVDMIAS